MDVKVRFRLNKLTGQVEIFEVADDGPMLLSEAEHNRQHDRIATELGSVIERNPRIDEVFGNRQPTEPMLESHAEPAIIDSQDERQSPDRGRREA